MANVIGEAVYRVKADTSGFQREAESGVSKGLSGISRVGRMAGLAALTTGFIGLGIAVRAGWKDFSEGARVAAQTNSVLKSTGGIAGVTRGHIEGLASAIEHYSIFDDEAVHSSENLLLTFTNVRDFVHGKFTGTFTSATKVIADMSTALGTDLQGTTIQVGKALQDPVKGMTALRRVGVDFSQSQQDLVKHLVDTGHTLEAQKLILHELNREFGGSAKAAGETFPGQLARLQHVFEDVMGSLVGIVAAAVSPALTELFKIVDVFDQLRQGGASFSTALGGAFQTLLTDLGVGQPVIDALSTAFSAIGDAIAYIADQISQNSETFKTLAIGFGLTLGTVLALSVAVYGLGLAFTVLTSPITIIAALGAAIFLLYQNNETFRVAVQATFTWLAANVPPVIAAIIANLQQLRETFQPLVEAILHFVTTNQTFLSVVRTVWNTALAIISAAILQIKGIINVVMGVITGDWGRAWQGIKQIFQAQWNAMRAILSGMIGVLGAIAKSVGSAILDGIVSFLKQLPGRLASLVGTIHHVISGAADAAFGYAVGLGQRIIEGVLSGLTGLAGRVASKIGSEIGSGISAAKGLVTGSPPGPMEHAIREHITGPMARALASDIALMGPMIGTALGASIGAGTVEAGGSTVNSNNRTVNVGQVILPTVTNGGDLVRQLDALVARPG
jgi:hypothetical protein